MFWAIIWYWLLGIFTVADIITTHIAFAMGLQEKNPILLPVVDHLIELKFAFLLLTIGIIVLTEKTKKGSGWLPAAAGASITFVAVIWNITQLMPLY